MSEYNSNYEIAQAISERIGTSPIPFDSVYEICLQIYNELGGVPAEFDSVYEILLGILPLVETGAGVDIQVVSELPVASENSGRIVRLSSDNLIYVAVEDDGSWIWQPMNSGIVISNYYTKSEVDEKIATITNTENADLEEKSTIDFTFVDELPVSGEEDQYIIIQGENQDTLYKYVSGAWIEQTPDANSLYFDTEGDQLYSYVSAEQQFAPISTVDTIIVSGNLNSNAALKQIKTAGNYNVLQHLTNATRGSYLKNWAMTVQAVDYDEYDSGDSVYQKLENNVTIYKRTWSGSRQTNDGWTVFSTYYEGLVKDTATSKYYTWSSNKLNTLFSEKQDTLTAGDNITIDASNTISANDTIEEVSALPEASENQDKLVRLNSGDKKVYASKLESSTTVTTDRLPDDEQIDKAYLYETSDDIYYYKGAYKLVLSDGEVNGYGWLEDLGGGEWYFYLTEDNAENITQNSIAYSSLDYSEGATIDETNKIVTNPNYSINDKDTLQNYGETPIVATYNAPEANQIGNAYLHDSTNDTTGTYTGEQVTFIDSDGGGEQVTGFKWEIEGSNDYIATSKPASNIYAYRDDANLSYLTDTKIWYVYEDNTSEISGIGYTDGTTLYIPQLNAPDSEQVGHATITVETEVYIDGTWQTVENVFTYIGTLSAMDYDAAEVETYYAYKNEEINKIVGSDVAPSNLYNISQINQGEVKSFYPIPNPDYDEDMWMPDYGYPTDYSTVKYQRSETTETWGWDNIATQEDLDDKQDTLTAGDNITISEDTISAANPIEEVSELPEASENQDKLVRLNSGDKKVYASKLESSVTVTTNKLPDDEQIDKAYLYEDSENFYYYKGAYKLVLSDGEVNGYGWLEDLGGGEWYFYLTEDNAENITQNSIAYQLVDATESATIDETNKIVTNPNYSINDKDTLDAQGETAIVATYNAPEANQIGNAYFFSDEAYTNFIYNGVITTIVGANGTFSGYTWVDEANGDFIAITDKPASEIYFVEGQTDCKIFITQEDSWTVEGNTWTNESLTIRFDNFYESAYNLSQLYIPQLNAPDSEQVGVATIENIDEDFTWTYSGEATVQCTNGDKIVYVWKKDGQTDFLSKYAANSQYAGKRGNGYTMFLYGNTLMIINNNINVDWNSQLGVYVCNSTIAELEEELNQDYPDIINIIVSTVKYQRSETTETWGWGEVINDYPTDAEIDALFGASVYYLLRDTSEDGYPLMMNECLQHNVGDTVEYDGQTCYRWIKYGDWEGEKVEDRSEVVVLTNTLDIDLPFTNDSPELVATLSFDEPAQLGDYWMGMVDPYVQLVTE